MQKIKPLLICDFDGVISDSLHDSYVTSLNTYLLAEKTHSLPLTAPLDPPSRVFEFEKEQPRLFAEFKRLIPMGNRAEDYFVIWRIIDEGATGDVRKQSDFERIRKEIRGDALEAYGRNFYSSRREQQETSPDEWASLSPVFEGIPEAIRSLSARFDPAIATSKDMRSIAILLKRYGLRPFFKPEFILDKDFSYSKRDHLAHFHEKFGIPYDRMHFIDDKALHLVAAKGLGINGYLALWGYNTPQEQEMALGGGFRLLNLEDFENLE
jgi:phosphoglycolate phosphatase-like HAD superfamily hydrolase